MSINLKRSVYSTALIGVEWQAEISELAVEQEKILDSLGCKFKKFYLYRENYVNKTVSLSKLSSELCSAQGGALVGFGAFGNFKESGRITKDSYPDVRMSFALEDCTQFVLHLMKSPERESSIQQAISVTEELAKSMAPLYGFAFSMTFAGDPIGYIGGSSQAFSKEISDEQRDERRRWLLELIKIGERSSNSQIRAGSIRDVFEWNVLSETALSSMCDGVTLQERIAKSAGELGSLTQLYDWNIWRVPRERIPEVQKALSECDVLMR